MWPVPVPARGVLEIRSADAEHAIAVYNPLVISYFSRVPKDNELALLRALANEALTQKIRGGMLMAIARKNAAGGINPKVREFFEEMVKKNSASFGASATVILMQGFGGSLMRSFLTSLLLLTNKRQILQIFASIDDACRWLAPQHDLDPPSLLDAYQKATASILARAG